MSNRLYVDTKHCCWDSVETLLLNNLLCRKKEQSSHLVISIYFSFIRTFCLIASKMKGSKRLDMRIGHYLSSGPFAPDNPSKKPNRTQEFSKMACEIPMTANEVLIRHESLLRVAWDVCRDVDSMSTCIASGLSDDPLGYNDSCTNTIPGNAITRTKAELLSINLFELDTTVFYGKLEGVVEFLLCNEHQREKGRFCGRYLRAAQVSVDRADLPDVRVSSESLRIRFRDE